MLPQITARLRPPRMGVIRLGIKTPGKNRRGEPIDLPREVPYFVLPESLAAAIPDKEPTRLLVLLPSDNPDAVLQASFTRYDGRLCTLQCDGREYWRWPKDGPRTTGTCCRVPEGSVEWPQGPGSCGASAVGRLSIIPLDGPLGVYQIPIGGEQRIADLYGDLVMYAATFGRLTAIVFEVVRVPTEVQIQGEDGKRMPRVGWPVRLFCSAGTRRALEASGRDLSLLPGAPATLLALPAAVDDVPALEEDDAPWDISASIGAAVRLGLTRDQYEVYVNDKYAPHLIGELSVEQEHEQETIVRKAEQEPQYAARFVAHVQKVAAKKGVTA